MSGPAGTGGYDRAIFFTATRKASSPRRSIRLQPERRTRTPQNQTLRDDPDPTLDSHNQGAKRGRGTKDKPRRSQELRATGQKASQVPRSPQEQKQPGPSSESSDVPRVWQDAVVW